MLQFYYIYDNLYIIVMPLNKDGFSKILTIKKFKHTHAFIFDV